MQIKLRFIAVVVLQVSFLNVNFSQAPDLGATSGFALFTASGAFNGDAATSITGDIGTNAGAFTPPGFLVGQIHLADPLSAQAAADVLLAYGYLAGLTCGSVLTTPLGNSQTLSPNIYCIGTAAVLNADLILDAGGDPGAVFIFQIGGALSTNSFSNIILINGANLCNVYWQINGAFNVGGSTVFRGTVVANGAINLGNGASLFGRGLSTAGAISTAANVVTLPTACNCSLDITCPPAAGGAFQCIAQIPAGLASNITINSSCGTAMVNITNASSGAGCTASPYVLSRTYTVTDDQAHIATCTATYTAVDNIAATITCPAAVAVQCANQVPAASTTSVTLGADNCGGPVTASLIGDVITNQTCANRFTITRTYRAADACGNTATCTQSITVNDQTAPAITCPVPVTVQCANQVPAANPTSVTVGPDNCAGTPTVTFVGDVITNQTCANRFTITRTYQVADVCGNSATCSQTITVFDNTAPTITCPTNVAVQCANQVPTASTTGIVASDNCGSGVTTAFIGDVNSNQVCANRFIITRTYRATDACGNTTNCSQTITVFDNTAPAIICPAPVTVQCASQVTAANTTAVTIGVDNCGGATLTATFVGDVTTGQSCPNRFTITRTYQVADICGNTATCAQLITVFDNTAPAITCPAPVTVPCASLLPAANTAAVTVGADNCGGLPTAALVSEVTINQTCVNRFNLIRTYSATDACGNSATCAQTITVFDNIAPTFPNPPINVTVGCLAIPPVATLTANDNCGVATVAFLGEIQAPGICPTLYTLTRTWRATDACGNSATVSQVVTVLDIYAPQFTISPINVVLECNLETNLDAYQAWLGSHGGAAIFDCSAITWTFINSPFPLDTSGCAGTFQRYIRFIATDACGNSAFQDASFRVIDLTPPTFTVPPQNLSIECMEGSNDEAALSDWLDAFGNAQWSDNCGSVTVSIIFISEVKGCGNTYTRTYRFRATDECGNTTQVTATFSVVDTTPPVVVVCPPGNVFLTCEFDVPLPDPGGVVATDNCGGVMVMPTIFSTGVGCLYSPKTVSYWYMVTDDCHNMTNSCDQSFQVVDSLPPVYAGPDTIVVICVTDLPGPGDLTALLAPFIADGCYDVICFSDGMPVYGTNWVTYTVKAKDLCGNWTDKFMVTFVATGACKPLCTAPQTVWGNPAGFIGGIPATGVMENFLSEHDGITAGKSNKTITVTSTPCLQNMLPGDGTTTQFSPGIHTFGAENDCLLSSPLLNSDGTLKNALAANVMALQLNLWYNLEYNNRNLGVQAFAKLSPCLVDSIVLSKMEPDLHNVQGLLNLSNDYLAAIGFFPQNFGSLLNSALENLNTYWQNCQVNDPCSSNVSIAGSLKTEEQEGLEMGQVRLDGSTSAGAGLNLVANSNEDGFYTFSNAVPTFGTYTLTPTAADMAPLNGVTTFDLSLISKHILGLQPLASPYKMIAADANQSGSITTLDILELRKLILGVYIDLPGDNSVWRFVDKSFEFPNPANPFASTFPERRTVTDIQASQMAADFVSVKIGDVNGSAKANSLLLPDDRSAGILLFDVDERQVKAGESFEVSMRADQKVQGYQFTLNTAGLDVLEASGEGMNEGNFAVFAADKALTSSWNLPEDAAVEVSSFTLKFHANQSGRLSEMLTMSSRITKAEAYESPFDLNGPAILDVALRFRSAGELTTHGVGFELYQNVPNPFVDKTLIGFHLPQAAQARLSVYDEMGKLIYLEQGDFDKGYNAFVIGQQLMTKTGALYYKLDTNTDTATRKMVKTVD